MDSAWRVPTKFGLWLVAISSMILTTVTAAATPNSVDANTTAAVLADAPYYYVGCYTARTDLLQESIYAKAPQTCIEICELHDFSYAILSAERCYCSNSLMPNDRQDEGLCNTRCLSNKAHYCGGVGVHSYYSSLLTKSLAPQLLHLVNATENSLLVAWENFETRKLYLAGAETTLPQKRITNFLIRSQVLNSYSSLPFFPQPEFIVQSSENRLEITDLHPATSYNISVDAMCGANVCGSASLVAGTIVGEPSPAPPEPKVVGSTDRTLTLKIPPIRNDNGPVTKLLVIVERVDELLSQTFDVSLLTDWQRAQEDGLSYYISAELDYQRPDDANKSRLFIVGDEKSYGKYLNAPLDTKAEHLHISLGVVSTLNGQTRIRYTHSTHSQHTLSVDNFKYATFETGQESVIALSVTCVIFGTCLLLSILTYFYLRYRTHQARHGGTMRAHNTHEMTLQQPIIDRENNGYVVEDEDPISTESFKQQLSNLLDTLDKSKRLPRNQLRMNINEVLAEGCYGEVVGGALLPNAQACQLHVLALDDLTVPLQAKLLREFRALTQLQPHEHILEFHGVSASLDWFYFVFEQQPQRLKQRLIDSRRQNADGDKRVCTLSEALVLQWIYEIASAMSYLASKRVVHKQLCSHCIYVTPQEKLKVGIFGPLLLVEAAAGSKQQVNVTRWLAPEVLRYQHHSSKADVWSFACVAWECCAVGATPYAHIASSQELLTAIRNGVRPLQPAFLYQDLYQMLLNCWQLEPSDRSSFEDAMLSVRQLMTSPKHAISFDYAAAGGNALPHYLPLLEVCN